MQQSEQVSPTKMVADTKGETKLVKILAKREFEAKVGQTKRLVKVNEVVEVDEATATEMCDKKFQTAPQYRGERESDDPANKHYITRAVRV